jgi:hypothetical protein
VSYRKRVDKSDGESAGAHALVRDTLRARGWFVHDMSPVGRGWPDLFCAKHKRIVLVEVKNPNQPPSKRKLNQRQVELHKKLVEAGVEVRVLLTIEDALAL